VTARDPLEGLAKALFEAARRERPAEQVRALALDAARAVPPRKVRTSLRRRGGLAVVALAAGLMAASVVAIRNAKEPVIAIGEEPRMHRSNPGLELPARGTENPVSESPPRPESSVTPSRSHAASSPSAGQRAATPPSLSDEIEMLDRARTTLTADPARALGVLDAYDHVLHGQRLTAEATLLRIEALSRSGNPSGASELARRFVDTNPGSALAERARAFITAGSVPVRTSGMDGGGLR
jgi:hypothetical protein